MTSTRSGTVDELFAWLRTNAFCANAALADPGFQRLDASINQSGARVHWDAKESGLRQLAGFFCCYLRADTRIAAADPAKNIPLHRFAPQHPIHFLQKFDSIEGKISDQFRRAFGEDLIVHRNAGNEVPLYSGQKPALLPAEDRVSERYCTELEKLAQLQSQGDGMRSFVGVMLHSLILNHSVVLIDEPEAFLHPPQAKLLGSLLAKESPKLRQFFIATHSGDFLRGVLDANVPNVRVVRIQRSGTVNEVKELRSNDIRTLWGNPLLRYSNVLDGLFHQKVVVCESDADCRFYAALLDANYESRPNDLKPDIMFTHCGGKDRIPVVVRSLCALGVTTCVVTDFDVLNDEIPFRPIVESLGGTWSNLHKDWSLVKNKIEEKKPELSGEEVREKITSILAKVPQGKIQKSTVQEIEKIIRRASPWSYAKENGKSFVPSGDPYSACERLLLECRKRGLFIVEVGELEGFARTVGGHGPAWVNHVLGKSLTTDPELRDAREFAMCLANFASAF